jgi:DNA-binding transcriptional LysR family regulator
VGNRVPVLGSARPSRGRPGHRWPSPGKRTVRQPRHAAQRAHARTGLRDPKYGGGAVRRARHVAHHLTVGSNGAIRESVQVGMGITLMSRDAVARELEDGFASGVALPHASTRAGMAPGGQSRRRAAAYCRSVRRSSHRPWGGRLPSDPPCFAISSGDGAGITSKAAAPSGGARSREPHEEGTPER